MLIQNPREIIGRSSGRMVRDRCLCIEGGLRKGVDAFARDLASQPPHPAGHSHVPRCEHRRRALCTGSTCVGSRANNKIRGKATRGWQWTSPAPVGATGGGLRIGGGAVVRHTGPFRPVAFGTNKGAAGAERSAIYT